jgi:hypothetical protein
VVRESQDHRDRRAFLVLLGFRDFKVMINSLTSVCKETQDYKDQTEMILMDHKASKAF